MRIVSVWWNVRKLGSRKPSVRAAAIVRLAELRHKWAVAPLSVLLQDNDRAIRAAVAQALGAIGHASAVGPLISTLLDEKYWDVRYEVVEALRAIGDPAAVNELLIVLDRPNTDISLQQFCAWALKEFGWEHLNEQQQAVVAILRDDWSLVPELGAAAIPPLMHAIKTGTHRMRRHASEALVDIDDGRGLQALVGLLKDPDAGVREVAATVIDKHAWTRLEPAQLARVTAVLHKWSTLATLGPEAVGPTLEMLGSDDREVRIQAMGVLGAVGGPRATRALGLALRDKDSHMRRAAAEALAQAADVRTCDVLVPALEDEDFQVREAVAAALARIGWKPAGITQCAQLAVARRDWETVTKLGSIGVNVAIEGLAHASLRAAVSDVLRQMGEEAVKPLMHTVCSGHTTVRSLAAELLGEIGDARAIPSLEAAIGDADDAVREAALEALNRLGWQPRDDAHRAEVAIKLGQWWQLPGLGAAAIKPLLSFVDDEREGEAALRAIEELLQGDVIKQLDDDGLRCLVALAGAPTGTGRPLRRTSETDRAFRSTVARKRIAQLARNELQRRQVPLGGAPMGR